MKAGNPLAGCLRFIVFTFSLAEIRLCRTVVRRRNGYSTTLRIFIYPHHIGMLKSADRKSEGVSNFFGKRGLLKIKFFSNINSKFKEGKPVASL